MLALMRGGVVFDSAKDAVFIQRALPYGHVVAALGMSQRLGLQRLLHRSPSRQRSLALAGIIARLLHPESKLGTARGLTPETATSSLGKLLHLGSVSGNEMLSMLDWLAGRQRWIEKSLTHRHLKGGTLLLYDVSSSYLEGSCCPLAQYGYNRDGKKGKKQIVFGLLCASNDCPVAVEVFAGNTADPTTLAPQVHQIRKRFHVERIALVGDRGLLTTAHLREDLKPVGLDWISALTTKHLQRLVKPHKNRTASLFPEHLVPDQVAKDLGPRGLSRRALAGLPQSPPARGATAQAGRVATGHRTPAGQDCGSGPLGVAPGQSRYCLPHRVRHQPPESEEAL